MSVSVVTLTYHRPDGGSGGNLRAVVNDSNDMVMLADVCGMFGLVCFAVMVTSFVSYVALLVCKRRDGPSVAKWCSHSQRSDAPVCTADCPATLSTLQHGVSHLAVIMDGNRRYGKRECARSAAGDDQEARARAIEKLCEEVCFEHEIDNGGTAVAPAAPFEPYDLTEPASHRSWFNDRYHYFLSLIHSTTLEGHRLGGEKLIDFIKYCIDTRIAMLTVYAFSSDNWNRPPHEVDALMTLFFFFFERIRATARESGIFVRFVSTEPERLPPRIQTLMRVIECESRTFQPRRITVNVCVSYSGQQEVLCACNRLVSRRLHDGRAGEPVSKRELDGEMLRSITQTEFEEADSAIFTLFVPREPQLVIRTSGEQRISNFLLYESAYAEFVFTSKTWPEITYADLLDALQQYCSRDKRLGK